MANTLSACGHYGIYVALQHLCGSMCQEWSDAEPALLSRCIEGSDVLSIVTCTSEANYMGDDYKNSMQAEI